VLLKHVASGRMQQRKRSPSPYSYLIVPHSRYLLMQMSVSKAEMVPSVASRRRMWRFERGSQTHFRNNIICRTGWQVCAITKQCSRVLEKPIVAQLVKKYQNIYGSKRFTTALKTSHPMLRQMNTVRTLTH